MEIVAIISIISVLAWFILGAKSSANLNNDSEDDLNKRD